MLNKIALSKSSFVRKALSVTLPVIILGMSSSAIAYAASEAKKAEAVDGVTSIIGSEGVSAEQVEKLKAQLIAEGKTPEEADAQIDAWLKQSQTK